MERRHKLETPVEENELDYLTSSTGFLSKESFKNQVKKCRKLFPVNIPVRVYYTDKAKDLGESIVTFDQDNKKPIYASIWVYSGLQRAHAIDTLIHEWTHVMYDSEGHDVPENHDCSDHDHTGLFWQMYGENYATWLRSKREP